MRRNRIVDSRVLYVAAAPNEAFASIQRIGGSRGWYLANFLWRLPGFVDLLVGGARLRPGRRDPAMLLAILWISGASRASTRTDAFGSWRE